MRMWTHIGLLLLIISSANFAIGQDSLVYEVSILEQIDSNDDVLLSYIDEHLALSETPKTEDFITNWDPKSSSHVIGRMFTFSDIYMNDIRTSKTALPLTKSEILGTVSFCKTDSSFVYCSSKNGNYSVYYLKKGVTKMLLKGKGSTHYIHPFITADGSRIFFSSNEAENYDIYFLNKIENDWSAPVKLSPSINSESNEVFPTWYNDTLYYSSSKTGNLDIYFSSKSSQYSEKKKLDSPFNSEKDDFLFHKLNQKVSILTSNRIGNKDAPFLIKETFSKAAEKSSLRGFIACSGNRISNVPLKLTSFFGIEIDTDVTDNDGNFLFRGYSSIKNYRIKLNRKDPRTKDCAVIYLTDEDGNVTQKIVLNDEGEFIFEILDTDKIAGLNLMPLIDESLLQVNIDGQVFENSPGDIGEGEVIKIVDNEDNLLALAYTQKDGSFQFRDLSPNKEYNFNFDEIEKQLQLLVTKNGEKIQVPVQNKKATYRRINDENALELIDENGSNITIETDEFFEIQNILYEFNSSDLSEKAKFQLDKLAQLIFNNDEILIELSSHTDSRGEALFNLNLSEQRVNSAIEYLISKGVNADRLKGYGMGEKKPINRCVDGFECTEEEHALNRRTEIRIIAL